ncbi:MAG: ABC transporter substrate-binding protein [Chloroflexi bacterium]|nr:ABC transporter substrate-binding protein [Chloroflexota bacterium]
MKCKYRMAVAFLLILALLVPLSSLGCGGGGGDERVTIVVGQMTDLTGIASPAFKQLTYVTQDMARYFNDEGLIPGAKIEVLPYDTKYDPSRYIPGYDWLKSKGAKAIITILADVAEVLKPFAERDKIPIVSFSVTENLYNPPGWAFGLSGSLNDGSKTLLKWVRENDWKGEGIPKIGLTYWATAQAEDVGKTVEAYLRDRPDLYQWGGCYTAPPGTVNWRTQAQRLKDCDYIATTSGTMLGYFLRDLESVGSNATVIDCLASMGSYRKFYADLVGWDVLDGCYSTSNSFYWTDSDPIVDLAKTAVHRYRSSSEAAEIIAAGQGYVGVAAMLVTIFEILQQTVEKVGAENFSGQAYYDAAKKYKTTSPMWQNYPEFGFGETKRLLMDQCLITGFKGGAVKDYVTLSGWLPAPPVED